MILPHLLAQQWEEFKAGLPPSHMAPHTAALPWLEAAFYHGARAALYQFAHRCDAALVDLDTHVKGLVWESRKAALEGEAVTRPLDPSPDDGGPIQ